MAIPVHSRGHLKPSDTAKLRRVLEEACRSRQAEPDSEEAKEVAMTLLALFNAGMVDEDRLMDAVAFRRLDEG